MFRAIAAVASGIGMWFKLARDRREYRRQPKNIFTTDGFEVMPGFFSAAECQRLTGLADRYLRDEGYIIQGNCYLARRAEKGAQVDTQVAQLFNVHEIDGRLADLYASGRIEGLFEARTGEKMRLQGITLQIDDVDTQTKRGFHIDSSSPPNYKAFIYLNDVIENGDGPYTVVPRSHRDRLKKVLNRMYNVWRGYPRTDMRLFYDDAQARMILGKAGTLVLSCQHLAHKGYQHHDRRRRYVLICYLVKWKHWDGKPLVLAKPKDKPVADSRHAA